MSSDPASLALRAISLLEEEVATLRLGAPSALALPALPSLSAEFAPLFTRLPQLARLATLAAASGAAAPVRAAPLASPVAARSATLASVPARTPARAVTELQAPSSRLPLDSAAAHVPTPRAAQLSARAASGLLHEAASVRAPIDAFVPTPRADLASGSAARAASSLPLAQPINEFAPALLPAGVVNVPAELLYHAPAAVHALACDARASATPSSGAADLSGRGAHAIEEVCARDAASKMRISCSLAPFTERG